MRRKIILCLCALIAAVSPLVAQTMWISANATSGTVAYTNPKSGQKATPAWIDGSIVVTCAPEAAGSNPSFTIDLIPRADVVNGSCARNANWRHYDTSGGNQSIYIDSCEIYKNQNHTTSADIIKTWDASGIGDANVAVNNVFTGQFSSNQLTQTFTFSAVFWHNSILEAGVYELPITFRLRNEAFSSKTPPLTAPVSTITIVLRYYVQTAAAIFFTSGNTAAYNGVEIFDLAFDELTAQAPREFTIHVQSNYKFYLSVKSANGGVLKHERYNDPNYPVREQIPYKLDIAGTTIPLASGTYRFPQKQGTTGFETSSRDYAAVLTIGDITSYSVGTYSDTLSFSVTSQ